MRYPKALRLSAVLTFGAAATIFAAPVVASGPPAAAAQYASSSAHVQSAIGIPREKVHYGFTGYSFADTSAGRAACEKKGQQLTAAGWGYSPNCILGDPDKGRWNLWMWLYG